MDVVRGLMEPTSLQPTTWGRARETGWPNITASASMPPTPGGGQKAQFRKCGAADNQHGGVNTEKKNSSPQPRIPRPLTMVVWESVPTTLSGYMKPSVTWTTLDRCSRFTWWTAPTSGGTTFTFLKAFEHHCLGRREKGRLTFQWPNLMRVTS